MLHFDEHCTSAIPVMNSFFFSFSFDFEVLENTYSTLIVWKKKQICRTTVNELRPLLQVVAVQMSHTWFRHQHQAHASSDIGETGQRTAGWRDLPKVPYAQCPRPDLNHEATARPILLSASNYYDCTDSADVYKRFGSGTCANGDTL